MFYCSIGSCTEKALKDRTVCNAHEPFYCDVGYCNEKALKDRKLCNAHAYPAEHKKTNRRQIIEAQKKRKRQENK